MRAIFRSLSMAAIVAGIAVTGAFAQNVCDDLDTPTARYETFTANYPKKRLEDLPAIKTGLAAGKEFLEKWGACEAWVEQAKFVKGHVPRLEKLVTEMEDFAVLKPFTDRFDAAVPADNYDEIYAAGKQIVAKQPGNLSAKFVMAVAGVGETAKAVQAKTPSKYASESLGYAKAVYDHIKGGGKLDRQTKDGKELIGFLKWERNREEALSQLAYTLGFLNYYGLNNKKPAVAQYYEVTQLPGFFKNYAPVYVTISDYYRGEAANILKDYATLTAEYNALVDQVKKLPPNSDPAVATKLDGEIKAKDVQVKAKEALVKGYLERSMDALSRGWKIAKDDTPEAKKYKDALYADLQEMYKNRFPEKPTGLNEWITAATAKPLPDPSSTVQPVSDEPATTTTTGTGNGVGAANGTGVGASNGTGVGAANGTGTVPKAGTTAKKP
ncbi:MAG: hypothetical protein ABL984_04000 [Pyrinomonadaceae bacterium]